MSKIDEDIVSFLKRNIPNFSKDNSAIIRHAGSATKAFQENFWRNYISLQRKSGIYDRWEEKYKYIINCIGVPDGKTIFIDVVQVNGVYAEVPKDFDPDFLKMFDLRIDDKEFQYYDLDFIDLEEFSRKIEIIWDNSYLSILRVLKNSQHSFYFNVLDEKVDIFLHNSVDKRSVKLYEKKYSILLIAKRYKDAIDRKDQQLLDLSRQLLEADDFDYDISLNDKTTELNYREHLVPCIKIHNEIIRMILANESLSKVAAMILQNLAILHISDSDAHKIDKDYKLRTDMPDGWKFGDSIFDRIVFSKIKF